MRLYEFKNDDGTIDVTVTTDGSGNQKRVFVTATPSGVGYQVSGSIPEGSGAIQALGFNFTNGVPYNHGDFVDFAEKNGLQLLQWSQGLGNSSLELVPLGGTYVYSLAAGTPVNFSKAGGNQAAVIVSSKKRVSEEHPQGVSANITSVTGEGFSHTDNNIVASANAGSTQRIGTAIVTQEESGKTAVINLIQAGA